MTKKDNSETSQNAGQNIAGTATHQDVFRSKSNNVNALLQPSNTRKTSIAPVKTSSVSTNFISTYGMPALNTARANTLSAMQPKPQTTHTKQIELRKSALPTLPCMRIPQLRHLLEQLRSEAMNNEELHHVEAYEAILRSAQHVEDSLGHDEHHHEHEHHEHVEHHGHMLEELLNSAAFHEHLHEHSPHVAHQLEHHLRALSEHAGPAPVNLPVRRT